MDQRINSSIERIHTQEYITFISQIGFVHPGRVKVIFNQSEGTLAKNSDLSAIVLAGKAKISHLEGNYHLAQKYMSQAFKIARKQWKVSPSAASRNALAYVHYESGVFYRCLYAHDLAISEYEQAKTLTSSSKLKLLCDFSITRMAIQEGNDSLLNKLISLLERIKQANLIVNYVLGLQNLGVLLHGLERYDEAEKYLIQARGLAIKHDLQYLVWTCNNSIGLLLHKQEKYAEATAHFEGFIDSVESHYIKTLAQKNLALRYRVNGEYDRAIELCKNTLEYARIQGVFAEIPGLAVLIGMLIRDYGNNRPEAYHFFKMGYDESMKQKEQGLPISGPRLRAVKGFVKFVDSYMPDVLKKLPVENYFEWTINRSWVEIQDVFMYNLFVYHFIHTGTGKKTFDHLKIKSATFYSIAKRMRDARGIKFPDLKDANAEFPPELYIQSMQQYVELTRESTFKEVRAQFESDVWEYMFRVSGYNKMRLSKSLDLSYSVVTKNTKVFTDIPTPSLPQLPAPE